MDAVTVHDVLPTGQALDALLSEPPPTTSIQEAERLARTYFDVEGRAEALPGERDRNFRISTAGGPDWVLKVVHPREERAVTELRGRALEHVASRDPGLPTPRIRRPVPGATYALCERAGQPPVRAQMYSYLPGVPVESAAPDPARQRNLGAVLARLDVALADFSHPAERHDLLWNASQVERVRTHVRAVPDAGPLLRAMDHFAAHSAATLPELRHQLIHNDANPLNVLASSAGGTDIAGIIDFGDIVRAPLVQEVATAAAYHVSGTGHPLAGPAVIARGYDAGRLLTTTEIAMLYDLIVARLVLSVAVAYWRARHRTDRAHFVMRTRQSRTSLDLLASVTCEQAGAYFRSALER